MCHVHNFPEPLPDEDFRSIMYRYHLMSPNYPFRESKKDLFGLKSSKNTMFPTRLDTLLQRLPIGHSFQLNDFIEYNTWASLVLCFHTKNYQEKMRLFMKLGEEELGQRFVFNFPGLFSKQIKYCPECMEEDDKKHGICYVHRVHQLSYLSHCPIHYSSLICACPHCNTLLSKEYATELISQPICEKCKCSMKTPLIDNTNSIIAYKDKLTKNLYLLRESYQMLSAEVIQQKIMMKLWELNFIHFRGRIMKQEFLKEMVSKLSIELNALGIENAQILSQHFLIKFLAVPHLKCNILFYTMLIQYLFESVERFLNYSYPIAVSIPFGNGPWKCYNNICENFNRNEIKYCKRKLNVPGSTVFGEFICPSCGYTYSRLWKPGGIKERKLRVVNMGHLWNEKVIRLHKSGYTVYKIQKEIGISTNAIINCIKQLNLKSMFTSGECIPYGSSLAMEEVATTSSMNKGQLYRDILLKTAKEKGITKRTTMLQLHAKEYNWLYRNDLDWLNTQFPRRKTIRDKIETEDLDIILAQKIYQLAYKLKQEEHAKIKKYTILNKLSPTEKGRLMTMKERFPLSAMALEQSVESIDSYLIRAVHPTCMKLKKRGCINITVKTLSGYRKEYAQCADETKEEIERLLGQFNNGEN